MVADLVEAAGTPSIGGAIDTTADRRKEKLLPGIAIGGMDDFPAEWPVVVAVGENYERARIVQELIARGRTFAPALIHPHAAVSRHAVVGVGTVVLAGAVINARASVGAHVIINTCGSVDHDCEISDFAHISPGVRLAGGVVVGAQTQVGTGACVIPNRRIGADCIVGAGAVVIHDLEDRIVAVGNPATVVRAR